MTDKKQYTVNEDEFIIEDYNNSKVFASFLPAVAGLWGKPLWVYYVNRGQAISNFGVRDKDGAMLEFTAANKAWRLTASQGLRTFYKINNVFYEPFRAAPDLKARKISQTMFINAHSVRLLDRNEEAGLESEVTMCTLPGQNFPALLRQLAIKNISSEPLSIECIDGLPLLHPFGTRNWMLKNLSRLAEGWFAGVHFSTLGTPYYKLPVEALDRPEIVPLHGAHFYCALVKDAFNAQGAPIYCIDPDTVFGEQHDYAYPEIFLKRSAPFIPDRRLTGKNKTPSAMGYFSLRLQPGAQAFYYSMAGHCADYENVDDAASLLLQDNFFKSMEQENKQLLGSIASCTFTGSAYKEFDTYCGQNFIDNALRGGFPVSIGEDTVYYAYSRVHGDMEREYNSFTVLNEYFSQGNGNYRDVNQNRRSDVFFNRAVGDDSIHFFMNLIQSDGFNPLVVLGVRFIFESEKNKANFINDFSHNARDSDELSCVIEKLSVFINEPVTIGALFNFMEEQKITLSDRDRLLASLLKYSRKTGLAAHGEGYWSDHWHYNTDLIENYLAIFPDRLKELLLDRHDYTFYDDCYFVEPRSVKYVLFRGMPRQIRAVRHDPEKAALIGSRTDDPNTVRINYGKGTIYYTNLFNKLLCIAANKYASLDPEGIGLEMETDKPNWCDALNGLPGLFGSSSAESLELLRLISFLINGLSSIPGETEVRIPEEVYALLKELAHITETVSGDFEFWDLTHTAKENYREHTRLGLSGTEVNCTICSILDILSIFRHKLRESLKKLENNGVNGIVPTCFAYSPESFEIDETAESRLSAAAKARDFVISNDQAAGTAALAAIAEEKTQPLLIHSFKRIDLPLFLEGPVHYLRLCPEQRIAGEFHRNMLASDLYDRKLKMFKNNAPVSSASRDIGRITVFTPGWLENESIWLHMEYKYLFELLRNNLAAEFFSIAKTALVPFFDPGVYGRSIFENASFIASSAHPEPGIHGQGFVARLSGATAEFISIWIALTSGLKPFSLCEGELCLCLQPCLPADFFTAANTFTFNFLGNCTVVYHNESRKDTFGIDRALVQSYRITFIDNTVEELTGSCIRGSGAHAIREGKAQRIDVSLG